jgi:hypothetical protein
MESNHQAFQQTYHDVKIATMKDAIEGLHMHQALARSIINKMSAGAKNDNNKKVCANSLIIPMHYLSTLYEKL